eukprot:359159-Chlamydomonas_euryale.AAC.17
MKGWGRCCFPGGGRRRSALPSPAPCPLVNIHTGSWSPALIMGHRSTLFHNVCMAFPSAANITRGTHTHASKRQQSQCARLQQETGHSQCIKKPRAQDSS